MDLPRRQEQLDRILVVRNDRIGDLVLTLPALEAIRRAWPQAHVAALASGYAGELLAGCRYVDEVLIDDRSQDARLLAGRLRPMQFDAALVINTSTRACLAAWRAGIRRRVFWAYKPVGMLLANRRVAVHRNRPPIHEAEFALAFVRRLGVDVHLRELAPRLELDPVAQHRVTARIERDLGTVGPLFGVHPGNGASAYNWPQSHYVRLVYQLAQYGRVMVTGTPGEQLLLDLIGNQLDAHTRSRVAFYSDFSLPELVAAIAAQTVLTASSTGPMHLAGILGRPVVGLFSPHPAHLPQKWAPLGHDHTLLVAPLSPAEDPRVPREQGTALMARISVAQVLDANLRYARPAQAAGLMGREHGCDCPTHRAA
jgi:ADP-heptose:LPS heptosyltransferase